jgi:hypothetical protein
MVHLTCRATSHRRGTARCRGQRFELDGRSCAVGHEIRVVKSLFALSLE